MTTTIQISDNVWKKINDLRKNPKETYNEVLERLLKLKKEDTKK